MAVAMFYGWENASGSALIKGKKFEKIFPAKVGWHRSLKLDLAPAH